MYEYFTLFSKGFSDSKSGKDKGSSQVGRECTAPVCKTNILCAAYLSGRSSSNYIAKLIVRSVFIHLNHYLVIRIIILVIHCCRKTVKT
jgi:hypothetical protein